MSQPVRLMIVAAAMIAGAPDVARASISELDRELYRELHRRPQLPLPPPAVPPAEVLACYERLAAVAQYAPVAMQPEPVQCAAIDLVRLSKVLMPGGTQVSFTPPPTLRCAMAETVAEWIRSDVGPAAAELGAPLASVTDVDSYQCRGRNNIPGAKLSEHGRGNALDVSAIKLGNGALFNLTDPLVSKPFREQMRTLACTRFTTVLGPGSDVYHSDHIHLDLAERRNGHRMCQWNVLDLASIAAEVPLPRPRPINLTSDEAKSR